MIYYKKKSWIKKTILKISRSVKEKNFSFPPVFVFLKISFFAFFSLISFLYIAYLFFLPKFVNEENAEAILNNYLSKNTKLTLDIKDLKIYPNYKFDINFKAKSIALKYPNNKTFLELKNPDVEINLLTLPMGFIDLNKIKAQKIVLSTNFTKSKKYSCFNYFDLDIFDLKAHNSKFELRNIRILCDEFLFNLYDENIKKSFYLTSKKVKFSMSEIGKPFNIATFGNIRSSNHKICDYNLDLKVTLKENPLDTFKTIISKLNYNPLIYADEYKFYTKADVKLQLKKNNIDGFINLKDFNFILSGIKLPKNSATLFFKGDKIKADCNFYLIKNQFIKTNIFASLSKNKFIELKINSSDINLAEFKEIFNIFSRIFYPKINPYDINLSGSAKADLYLRSDFKTIKSKGILNINNAKITHKPSNFSLQNINSDINFEDNKINIKNTSAYFDRSKFYLTGIIDDKTNLNLKINSDLINISRVLVLVKSSPLFSIIAPKLEDYNFTSGFLKINAQILGNIQKPVIQTKSSLSDFKVYIKPYKTNFKTKEILIDAQLGKDIFINLSNIVFSNPQICLNIPASKLKISNNIAYIEKSAVDLNNIKISADGKINLREEKVFLNLFANNFSNNKFFIIKNKNAVLKANILLTKNKLQIIEANIFDKTKKIVSISGFVSDFRILNDLKISIEEKTGFLIPYLNNLSFMAYGNLSLNGEIEKPDINGDLKLYNINYSDFNLFIKDLILNIKNSSVYINIAAAKIFDFDFDLIAQGKYLNNKILISSLNFNSSYINLDSIQKYLNKAKNIENINLEVNSIKGYVGSLETMGCLINSVNFEGKLNNNILNLQKFSANAFNGSITGSLNINLKNYKTRAELILKGLNVRHLSHNFKELSIAASGKLSALITADIAGFDFDSMIKTLDGYIKFNINDGELSQFAKLERFLQAGNILSQSILKLTLNSTISAITKQNTGDFKTIEGTIKIKDANANIQYIKTQGTNMSLYITGKFNLLSRNSNLKVLGRIPSSMVSVLGNVGRFSTGKLVDKLSQDTKEIINTITVSPIEKLMSVPIEQEDIEKIPPLVNPVSGVETREFLVFINGNIENTSSIKYFKWRVKD